MFYIQEKMGKNGKINYKEFLYMLEIAKTSLNTENDLKFIEDLALSSSLREEGTIKINLNGKNKNIKVDSEQSKQSLKSFLDAVVNSCAQAIQEKASENNQQTTNQNTEKDKYNTKTPTYKPGIRYTTGVYTNGNKVYGGFSVGVGTTIGKKIKVSVEGGYYVPISNRVPGGFVGDYIKKRSNNNNENRNGMNVSVNVTYGNNITVGYNNKTGVWGYSNLFKTKSNKTVAIGGSYNQGRTNVGIFIRG